MGAPLARRRGGVTGDGERASAMAGSRVAEPLESTGFAGSDEASGATPRERGDGTGEWGSGQS
jgi:hypothetical protein